MGASIRQAEKKALTDDNESQDSQQIMDAYMRMYGVGVTSSSPVRAAPAPAPPKTSFAREDRKGFKNPRNSRSTALVDNTRSTRDVNGLALSNSPALDSDLHRVEDRASVISSSVADEGETQADASRPKKKMDSSQSPTQSNDGRSYEKYNLPPSSPGHPLPLSDQEAPSQVSHARTSSPQPRPSEDDDTVGIVNFNFDDIVATNRTSPSVQDESGLVDFGSLARQPNPPPVPQFPETPAHPLNPFHQSRSQLLPPSQLFGATQFSSAFKHASPTSSRPSPDDFAHNSISPNLVISSPLKTRGLRSTSLANPTSSPQILPGTVSSRVDEFPSSPVHATSRKSAVIPDSSRLPSSPRKKSVPEPMSTYEPMRKSQERRSTSVVRSDSASIDEEDDDDSMVRRRKAKSKKEAALKQLTAISFTRPLKSDDIEVPSTNKRRARNTSRRRAGHCADGYSDPRDTVADSQEDQTGPVQQPVFPDQESTQSDLDDIPEQEAEIVSSPDIGLPEPRANSVQPEERPVLVEPPTRNAIPETSPTEKYFKVHKDKHGCPDLPPLKTQSTAVFQSSPPILSTRSQKAKPEAVPVAVKSLTSSLSNLASTPQLPSSITSVTEISAPAEPSAVDKGGAANSSPAVAKSKRRQAHGGLSKSKPASAENLRQSMRLGRRYSGSTDELSGSVAATPTFEQNLRVSRLMPYKSKSGRGTTKQQQHQLGSSGIFEGMAFAISFQGRKPGESSDKYKTRMDFASTVEKKIKQAGGRILVNGFDELFEPLSSSSNSSSKTAPIRPLPDGVRIESEIKLTSVGKQTRFTALVADGHSRKVKYMQALALGLPCIATRWVTSCLEKNELVDWTPYLLCAGESAFLGDAIRSRNLATYDASSARLTEVIRKRTKLLAGSKILLVMKKSLEGRKMAYVFLARVLGATLSRVYSIEEARAEMKVAEDAGQPFDWVYVDGKSEKGDLFTSLAQPQPGPSHGGRKRKRASVAAAAATATATATDASESPFKKIRTLTDELVIQSLILGRMIEEGEMDEKLD
ncbi:hypothetical protein B0H66DRAFT_140794 [Apodospora peruviana]|uniref:BRCT domain-containing protein n=1 Tax=Apodospora peruviana TaxID=516989 RepID=A0AAE0III2_9PEZI|nr:hypothetical protein B0H66DRAFT_140794 [Apodospora peruviana]